MGFSHHHLSFEKPNRLLQSVLIFTIHTSRLLLLLAQVVHNISLKSFSVSAIYLLFVPSNNKYYLCLHFFFLFDLVGFFKKIFYLLTLFRERGREGEREGEKQQCARDTR